MSEENKYPYIGKAEKPNTVVLFTSVVSGFLLSTDTSNHGVCVMDYNESWVEYVFKNISYEYLQNTYGKVESPEHADFIIKLAKNCNHLLYSDDDEKRYFSISNGILYFYDNEEGAKDDNEKFINIPFIKDKDKDSCAEEDDKPKAVWNAVNKLKGDLSNVSVEARVNDYYLSTSNYLCYNFEAVCKAKEFNDLVEEMETNFGRSFTAQQMIDSGYEFKVITVKTKPQYTQAMFDAGELPSVGMWFIDTEYAERPVQVIAHDFDCVVYRSRKNKEDAEYFRAELHECRPIAPPVELIDGEAYQFDSVNRKGLKGVYNKVNNKIMSSDCDFKLKDCTNIKPLVIKED